MYSNYFEYTIKNNTYIFIPWNIDTKKWKISIQYIIKNNIYLHIFLHEQLILHRRYRTDMFFLGRTCLANNMMNYINMRVPTNVSFINLPYFVSIGSWKIPNHSHFSQIEEVGISSLVNKLYQSTKRDGSHLVAGCSKSHTVSTPTGIREGCFYRRHGLNTCFRPCTLETIN